MVMAIACMRKWPDHDEGKMTMVVGVRGRMDRHSKSTYRYLITARL